MFPSSRNDVLLILLTLLLHSVNSQRLQEKIEKLPSCSKNCIASAAQTAGCAADDFACQCQKPDSLLGLVGNVLGSVTSQNLCLVNDCGIADAASVQLLFRQICSLAKGTTTSSTSTSPTVSTSTTALAESTPPPPPATTAPSPQPTVDFTAPLADSTPTEQAPLPVLSTLSTQPIVESSTASTSVIVQSTPIPAFTLPPHTTLQTSTSSALPPPQSTSSTISSRSSSKSTSVPVTSVPQSSAPAMQASPISSSTPPTSVSTSASTSVSTPIISSTQPAPLPTTSTTRLLPSTTPTSPSYQAEANQSSRPPMAQTTNTDTPRLSPAVITAIVLGILAFVVLTTFISVLFRRRHLAMKRKRAMSTMTAGSRRSGEEITVYLDLGGGGGFGGVGNGNGNGNGNGRWNSRVFSSFGGAFGGSGGKGGERMKSVRLDVPPSPPMVERGRGPNFKFKLRGGLDSHPGMG
ncbi:hypothetical protein BKA65DRAFT_24553 [Rhexocercosporidium sp. MPI-PUGE-AT-0058]|nr:hypothetical protein BKA65DRAFT_24553 [Rhexocercosporidium sp. MPI-PUGE-AT-0058]